MSGTIVFSGGYYHASASYYANGLVDALAGVGLPSITYTPDGEGRILKVSGGTQNPVSSTSYSVFGSPTAVTFGSGDSDAFTPDSNTGRMKKYDFTVGSNSVVGNLMWNPNGTLGQLAITDPLNSANQQTCIYAYDDLGRIASGDCLLEPSTTQGWWQTFSSDAFGNLSKTGKGAAPPAFSPPPLA